MHTHNRLLTIAILAAAATAPSQPAKAQVPAAPAPAGVTPLTDPYMPNYSSRNPYRSRTAPMPPPRDPDADYGFRNPGGVGRVREYYPPGNSFERGSDPVRVAQFGTGPSALSRESQMQAQMVGNARTRTLNAHIDAYARPIGFGYGFGFGGFGGFPF